MVGGRCTENPNKKSSQPRTGKGAVTTTFGVVTPSRLFFFFFHPMSMTEIRAVGNDRSKLQVPLMQRRKNRRSERALDQYAPQHGLQSEHRTGGGQNGDGRGQAQHRSGSTREGAQGGESFAQHQQGVSHPQHVHGQSGPQPQPVGHTLGARGPHQGGLRNRRDTSKSPIELGRRESSLLGQHGCTLASTPPTKQALTKLPQSWVGR